MERDGQHKLKVKAVDLISVTALSAPYVVAGTAIDTTGARKVTFAVQANEAIGTDVANLVIYECDTTGGTYTVIDDSKYIFTADSQAVVDKDSANNLLTVGCFGTKKFIKPYIDAVTIADDITFNVYPVLEMAITNGTGIDDLP